MSRPIWIEFLDERLQTPGDKILQENIFIVLLSLEMTVLARFCTIIHITIYLLTRLLTGNYLIVDDYNWYVHSMGRIINDLEKVLEAI